MNTLIFWREWNKTPRILYTLLLIVFFAALSWFMYHYLRGSEGVFGWKVNTELDVVPVKLNSYTKGIFQIPIEGASYVVKEGFETVDQPYNHTVGYIYGGLILLAMCILLTVISTLQRLWYMVGMAVFMLFLSWFGFGYLGKLMGNNFFSNLAGDDNSFLIVCMVLYGVGSYFFQSFGKHLGLLPRFFTFIVITAGLAVWIGSATDVKYPVMYLTSFGWVVPLALTLIFMTIVGHDIVYGFFHLITKYNPGSKSNSIHFGVISFIYLGNLLLIFLKDRGTIDLDILYLDLHWLFAISAILGIWGYRRRGVTIRKFISFAPQGGLLYLSLGIIAFATMAYYHATGNDAIISVLRDIILFSHLGYGIAFVIYAYVNLGVLMGEKVDITKVVYQGELIPHPMLRLLGLIFIFGFYSGANQIQREQLLAGHYCAIAETYKAHGDKRLTQKYYDIATQYFFYTHQPHYALADIKMDGKTELTETITHLKNAILSLPNEYTYAKLAQIYTQEEQNTEAIITLQEAVQKFPKSMQLHNNLALAYSKTQSNDSTIYYFDKASALANGSLIPKNNLLAYLASKKSKNFDPKNLERKNEEAQDLSTKSNRLTLYNVYQTSYQQSLDDSLKVNPRLDNKKFAYIYNYLLNRAGKRDNKVIDSVLAREAKKIELNKENRDYAYFLQYVRACFQYYGGSIADGIKILSSIPSTKTSGYYNVVLGLWLLEQGAYESAISYLETAKKLKNTQADIYLGIALSEKGDFKQAIDIWKQVIHENAKKKGAQKKKDSTALMLAEKVINAFSDTIALNTDEEKFILIHYRHKYLNEENLLNTYNAIQASNYKTWAAADLINYYLDLNKIKQADDIYKTLKARNLDSFVKAEINHAYLRLLTAQKQNDLVLQFVNQLELGSLYRNKKPYFLGMVWYDIGDHKKAQVYFDQALKSAPFSEEVVLSVADFYLKAKKDVDKAYSVVTNAVRINPYSLPLYKSYAMRAIEMGLDSYGDSAVKTIQDMTNQTDFERFKKAYETYKAALEEKRLSVK